MNTKLYVLPGSHPCAAVEAALKIKRIAYQRVDLLPLSQLLIGPIRFGGATVPGLRIGGERLVGSRTIMRRLEELEPEPVLYPPSPDVLAAEQWGDEVLQNFTRRLVDVFLLRQPAIMEQFVADARLPLPIGLMRPALGLTAKLMAAKNKASEQTGREDLAALPGHLERVDSWIRDGTLGGEAANAADLQIGSSIRLLWAFCDLRPLIQAHPAGRLVDFFPPLGVEVEAGILRPD